LTKKLLYKSLTFIIASVWLVNGLFCKALNYVPRHQEIVGAILGNDYAEILTILIGVLEIAMAIWVISEIKSRVNSILQITIIGLMNILEFILVPELLLWGRFNILFASIIILVIYYNEFILKKKFV
jgi:hypothetical protein